MDNWVGIVTSFRPERRVPSGVGSLKIDRRRTRKGLEPRRHFRLEKGNDQAIAAMGMAGSELLELRPEVNLLLGLRGHGVRWGSCHRLLRTRALPAGVTLCSLCPVP